MNNNTSFWNYLKNNLIEIPIIQRDYAQGRLGKENLRKNFLTDLKRALDTGKMMKLDFVYGSSENERLNPLDGQQRLTTLWLLHWYIALHAGVLNEDNCAIFRKFTYETRISSREFCQNLCIPKHFEKFSENKNGIVDFIINQTWFYSAWKQDPTIQSMLRMLGGTKIADKKGEDIIDGIEELFNCPKECIIEGKENSAFMRYWEKLVSDDAPIVFYHLPLQDFGLSDDLYIKMNARGKQLTSFENFKADLIGYITKQSENELLDESNRAEWKELLAPESGIPIKLDTDWTDVFWKNKSIGIKDKESIRHKSNQIDEIYFAFLNRFFWNELFTAKKADNPSIYILEIGKGDDGSAQENENSSYRYLNDSSNRNPNDFDTKVAYHGLDEYKYDNGIPIGFFRKLQKVLNNYYNFTKTLSLPTCSWDDSFRFVPQYVKDSNADNIEITNNANDKILRVSTLNQVQRIVFFALCKYFDHDETVEDNELTIKRWMRVVWNLISGQGEDGRPQIRSAMAIRTAIEHIDRLDAHNVYNSLESMPFDEGTSDFSGRWNEEINKAKQIICGEARDDKKNWEMVIIEAEKYAFFRGSIRFLFQDENGQVDWSLFDVKWDNAKKYFREKTDSKPSVMQEQYHNADLLKMMFSWYSPKNFWNVIWWKHRTFNNKPETWLYYLLNKDNCKPIHHLMLGEKNNLDISPHSTNIVERTIYLLSCTSLLDFIREKIPNSWIRDYHYHKAIFPSGKGVFLDAEKRDTLLATTQEIKIDDGHTPIKGTNLLYGSDINFTYNGHKFKWYRNDYVFLMNDESFDIYKLQDENAHEDIDKYYCFNAKTLKDSSSLVEHLNGLINDASQKNNETR